MVTLTGICRFRVTNLIDGFLSYPTANINWDSFGGDLKTPNENQNINREKFFDVLERYFKIMELSTDWDGLKDADDMLLINSLAMLCPFEPEEKQALLEAPSLDTRRETLVTLMEFAYFSIGNINGIICQSFNYWIIFIIKCTIILIY